MAEEVNEGREAILAGGCFWCLEAVYEQVRGVQRVQSGYIGGQAPNPGYEQVCAGTTGHAEAVRITFDAALVSFEQLLEIFFSIHDPTTLNRQGNDVGSQYRSAIYYLDDEQRIQSEAIIERLSAQQVWPDPVVTEVTPAGVFYPAEDYHQHYYARNPGQGYCHFIIAPKLAKFRKVFADMTRQKG